jgi:hypothetical protein
MMQIFLSPNGAYAVTNDPHSYGSLEEIKAAHPEEYAALAAHRAGQPIALQLRKPKE